MEDDGEQLLLVGMPRPLFAGTPSRLAAFDCPRRYRFTYLLDPPPTRDRAWAHSAVGAAVHVALQRWWDRPRARRTPDEGAALLSRHWPGLGFRDDAHRAHALDVVAGWVRRYLERHVDPDHRPLAVERTVRATTGSLAASGRIDRLDDRAGAVVVVDYKVGRSVPDPERVAAAPALALYALGVSQTLHRPCRRVELHHLPSDTIAVFTHTTATLSRHVERAERIAAAITAATAALPVVGADRAFPPAPSPACTWCDFRSRCPEGRAAAPDATAWAGLPGPAQPAEESGGQV